MIVDVYLEELCHGFVLTGIFRQAEFLGWLHRKIQISVSVTGSLCGLSVSHKGLNNIPTGQNVCL